ncbi:MAG: alpha-hydroxy acid oxidase [Hyphomonadaceae bacterium]
MPSLSRAINIADLRLMARARLPRMVFDYIDGGADDEITLQQSVSRLRAYRLMWDALVDVSTIDLSTRVMGADLKLPFVISPTATSRLFHHEGEAAVAAAATAFGTAYSLSSIGSTSVEEIAKICPGPKWFQVYVWKDRGLVREILARAKAAGFTGLLLTVDVPVAGNRERDPRNRFTIPPAINPSTVSNMLSRPEYLWNLATHPRIRAANFTQFERMEGGVIGFINSQFDCAVTWKDAAWMRETWDGPFAVKGVTHAEDAKRCAEIGAAAWISNHGGRQLDTAPATIDVLEEIAAAVAGRTEIIFDGGVRRGADIVKALALGANAVAIGRAYLFGLAAGGQAGVMRALTILKSETERTLALLGCPRVRDLSARFVRKPV